MSTLDLKVRRDIGRQRRGSACLVLANHQQRVTRGGLPRKRRSVTLKEDSSNTQEAKSYPDKPEIGERFTEEKDA